MKNSDTDKNNLILNQASASVGSICWLNMVPNGGSRNSGMDQIDAAPTNGVRPVSNGGNAPVNGWSANAINGSNNGTNFSLQKREETNHNSAAGGSQTSSSDGRTASTSSAGETSVSAPSPTKDPNNCLIRAVHKVTIIT